MGKRSKKLWITLFTLAVFAVIGFYYYVYEYRPPEFQPPKFTWMEMLIIFALGFFPSVLSRLYANVMTGQTELDWDGVIDSFRDSVHGWYMYYILLILAFVLWDYLIYHTLPEFW